MKSIEALKKERRHNDCTYPSDENVKTSVFKSNSRVNSRPISAKCSPLSSPFTSPLCSPFNSQVVSPRESLRNSPVALRKGHGAVSPALMHSIVKNNT